VGTIQHEGGLQQLLVDKTMVYRRRRRRRSSSSSRVGILSLPSSGKKRTYYHHNHLSLTMPCLLPPLIPFFFFLLLLFPRLGCKRIQLNRADSVSNTSTIQQEEHGWAGLDLLAKGSSSSATRTFCRCFLGLQDTWPSPSLHVAIHP
jgi:hypothetical protein